MKRRLIVGLGLAVLAGPGYAQRGVMPAPPIITGYGRQDCVAKGGQLLVQGMNFGNAQIDWQLVLWAGGVEVETSVLTWHDTQVLIRIPDDARIKEGQRYELRAVRRFGNAASSPGPALVICAAKPAAATRPGSNLAPGQDQAVGLQVVTAVMRVSGAAHWQDVKRLRFTFNVAQDGKQIVATRHDWDVRGGTDKVSWEDKTVTVNLRQPAADADSQAAYKRWVNDSYWLLMPLKLSDPGVHVVYSGRSVVAGKPYDLLRLSFGPVGVTSQDQYQVYVDPATHLVSYWDYLPDTTRHVSGTWETYAEFGGLKLSTEHQFGDKRVWFSDVQVEK